MREPIETGRKLMTVAKSNLAKPEDKKTYAFSIATKGIPATLNKGTDNAFTTEIETATVVWHDVVDVSAQTVSTKDEKRKRGPSANKLEEAVVWLRSVLYSHDDLVSGHPVYRERRSKEVDTLRAQADITKSTYERAKGLLGVTAFSKEGEYWLSVAALTEMIRHRRRSSPSLRVAPSQLARSSRLVHARVRAMRVTAARYTHATCPLKNLKILEILKKSFQWRGLD